MSFQSSQHSQYGSGPDFSMLGNLYSSTDVLGVNITGKEGFAQKQKVMNLQNALAKKGYGLCQSVGLTYDCEWEGGLYDAATKKAVEEFQRDSGLTVDGKAGKNTLTKLGLKVLESRANQGRPALPSEILLPAVSKPDHPAVAAIQKYKWPVVGVTAAGVGYYVWWKFFRK